MLFKEGGNDPGHHTEAAHRGQRHVQLPLPFGVDGCRLLPPLALQGQNGPGVLQVLLPQAGRAVAAIIPGKELAAGLLLQLAQAFAEGGLGDVKLLSGLGQVLVPGDREGETHILQVHPGGPPIQ